MKSSRLWRSKTKKTHSHLNILSRQLIKYMFTWKTVLYGMYTVFFVYNLIFWKFRSSLWRSKTQKKTLLSKYFNYINLTYHILLKRQTDTRIEENWGAMGPTSGLYKTYLWRVPFSCCYYSNLGYKVYTRCKLWSQNNIFIAREQINMSVC